MLKKVYQFARSMKFGMFLLSLIVAISLAGSFVQQGYEAAFYEAAYPRFAGVVLALGLDNVFSTWYFITLMALLCLSLLLCSASRLRGTVRQAKNALLTAQNAALTPADRKDVERIRSMLKARRLKEIPQKDGSVFYKNKAGYYGSFLTHVGLLLTLVSAGGAMWIAVVEDFTLNIGETAQLSDGVSITLESFRLTDEEGHTDYVSEILVRDGLGGDSGTQEISVNYPYRFAGHKYYQQSYGTMGCITVTNEGVSDSLLLDEPMFLSLDGETGLLYHGLYPDHLIDENGQAVPLQSTEYKNPIYTVAVMDGGNPQMGFILPGETIEAGGILFRLEEPVHSSGIRVKTIPPVVLGLLYGAFALLTLGVYMCFFIVPVFVNVTETGYCLVSPKKANEIAFEMDRLTANRIQGKGDDSPC